MLQKLAASILFLSIFVAAVPLWEAPPRDRKARGGKPMVWDQQGNAVYEQRRVEMPSDLRVNHEKSSSEGGGATPQEKKPAEGKGRKPVQAEPAKGDTPTDGESNAPEKSTDKTQPAEGETETSIDDKKPVDGAEPGGGTKPTKDTKPDDSKPTDGTGSTDGPPRGEPGGKKPPSTNEDPKTVTGPSETGGTKPPSSENSPTDGKEPSVPNPQPKDTGTLETGKDKPDFVPDGEDEDPLDDDLTPASVIGGVIAGAAILAAAFVAWSRRSVVQSENYEPVQADEIDADGWNDGWDDGWDEGTSTKA